MNTNFYESLSTYDTEFWNALRQNRSVDTATYKNAVAPFTRATYLPAKQGKEFAAALDKECLIRRLGTVMATPHSDRIVSTASSEAEATWVQPGAEIPEDDQDPRIYRYSMHKLASIVTVHEDLLEDRKFDLEGYLMTQFVRRFARAEEKAFLLGTGNGQPTGILAENGGAEIGITADRTGLTLDDVLTLFHCLDPRYREKAVWIMNDETALTLRSLKDAAGNYLWPQPSEKLLGKDVVIANTMPGIASGDKPIAFGDFSYYWIIERVPFAVRALFEKYIAKQTRGFIGYEHLDGKLICPEAVKVLKVA